MHSPSCPPPECYCIPKGDCFFNNFTLTLDKNKLDIPDGNHDYDYYFVLTVENNARLVTNLYYQVTTL